jgi:hypothetical protein
MKDSIKLLLTILFCIVVYIYFNFNDFQLKQILNIETKYKKTKSKRGDDYDGDDYDGDDYDGDDYDGDDYDGDDYDGDDQKNYKKRDRLEKLLDIDSDVDFDDYDLNDDEKKELKKKLKEKIKQFGQTKNLNTLEVPPPPSQRI